MRGLLLKDYYAILRGLRGILMLFAFYLVLGLFIDNIVMTLGLICFVSVVATLSLFSGDDISHWEGYAVALPVSRSDIVSARYVVGLMALGAGVVASFVLWGIMALFGAGGKPIEVLAGIGGSTGAALLIMEVMFPLAFRYGVERARFALMGLFLLPVALVSLLNKLGVPMPQEDTVILILQIAAGVVLVGVFFSWKLSCAIYADKEVE